MPNDTPKGEPPKPGPPKGERPEAKPVEQASPDAPRDPGANALTIKPAEAKGDTDAATTKQAPARSGPPAKPDPRGKSKVIKASPPATPVAPGPAEIKALKAEVFGSKNVGTIRLDIGTDRPTRLVFVDGTGAIVETRDYHGPDSETEG